MNVVMTGTGDLIEVQGTAEERPFSQGKLHDMLKLATQGVEQIVQTQRTILGELELARS
jgi:ribonuclease PH